MAKKNVAVLDFGSSRVSVIIAERGVNNTFDVRGFGEVNYAGFMDGEFLEPEKLSVCVMEAIETAQDNARCRITHLYVGVPAEFSVAEVRTVSRAYPKRKKVTEEDIEELFAAADEFSGSTSHEVINRSPIYFEIDDNRRVIEPKGIPTSKLSGVLSFILCERKFTGIVSKVLEPARIPYIQFISEALSESLFLIEPEQRDKCALLVDCGYITTSVCVIMGDGVMSMRCFSLGGGHIVADLAEYFKIPFSVAEALKRKIVLSFQPEDGDFYEITINEEPIRIDAEAANAVVGRKVNQIGKMIQKCLNECKFEYPEYLPVLLTGGGVCYIKGARNELSKVIGKEVQIVAPKVPQMDKPHVSAVLGLMDVALKFDRPYGLFAKLFKKK